MLMISQEFCFQPMNLKSPLQTNIFLAAFKRPRDRGDSLEVKYAFKFGFLNDKNEQAVHLFCANTIIHNAK